jgi:hypothetical protein
MFQWPKCIVHFRFPSLFHCFCLFSISIGLLAFIRFGDGWGAGDHDFLWGLTLLAFSVLTPLLQGNKICNPRHGPLLGTIGQSQPNPGFLRGCYPHPPPFSTGLWTSYGGVTFQVVLWICHDRVLCLIGGTTSSPWLTLSSDRKWHPLRHGSQMEPGLGSVLGGLRQWIFAVVICAPMWVLALLCWRKMCCMSGKTSQIYDFTFDLL